jgi:hypothetical protein
LAEQAKEVANKSDNKELGTISKAIKVHADSIPEPVTRAEEYERVKANNATKDIER